MAESETRVTEKVQELERERDKGTPTKPGRPPTVADWMTTYLDTICAPQVASGKMAPRTLDDYWSKTRNWIVPRLGKHRLDRLTPEHLERMYAVMFEVGKAPSHVLKVHRILSRALDIAHRRGAVSRNIAKLVDAPRAGGDDNEVEAFSQEEVRAILREAAKLPNGERWTIGLALGLRQGESLGLCWKYIDLDRCEVRVWWQIQRNAWKHGCPDPVKCTEGKHRRACPKDCQRHRHKPDCPAGCTRKRHVCPPVPNPCPRNCTGHARSCPQRVGGGLVFRRPKGKSRRTVPFPAELVPLLQEHRARQDAVRIAAGEQWQDHDLVFCREDGRPIDPRHDWEEWKGLLRRAGVRDARVHDGRHSTGALLIEQGVNMRTVQEILGHSDIRVTQRYTHVASPVAREAARQMGSALFGRTDAN
ncbi:site-specific integrase [Lipingzhangella sp. LS1_29]|uniref:Site-specific integrase n=1 Tax=Lipingzhangella rawalii TaxID=2055835 RepID=A0ABU2H9T9_9ACTN|nr:site-specific integrase [Lipingzhangella rawalii]MDS1271772.1 site-specific integrase [Lipingzhangella rawalii]